MVFLKIWYPEYRYNELRSIFFFSKHGILKRGLMDKGIKVMRLSKLSLGHSTEARSS